MLFTSILLVALVSACQAERFDADTLYRINNNLEVRFTPTRPNSDYYYMSVPNTGGFLSVDKDGYVVVGDDGEQKLKVQPRQWSWHPGKYTLHAISNGVRCMMLYPSGVNYVHGWLEGVNCRHVYDIRPRENLYRDPAFTANDTWEVRDRADPTAPVLHTVSLVPVKGSLGYLIKKAGEEAYLSYNRPWHYHKMPWSETQSTFVVVKQDDGTVTFEKEGWPKSCVSMRHNGWDTLERKPSCGNHRFYLTRLR